MEAAAPEKLLEAFHVLDVDGKGIISRDYIAKLMMEEGEPFTQVTHVYPWSVKPFESDINFDI